MRIRLGTRLRDEGAVLPVALFGLLAMSLLVASAMLTASSELALSQAHQDGVRSLLEADAALEIAIAAGALRWEGEAGEAFSSAASAPSGREYTAVVTPLSRGEVVVDSLDIASRRDLYSVAVEPANGRGRLTGALVRTVSSSPFFRTGIDAAATVGGRVHVTSGALISAVEEGLCTAAEPPSALRVGMGPPTGEGAAGIVGGVEEDTIAGLPLLESTLNGSSLDVLSEGATHYFGVAYGAPAFDSSAGPRHDALLPAYRWGCPEALVFSCPRDEEEKSRVVVIDGGADGVDLDGGHGEGVLVIRGAGASLSGEFRFSGAVLVEGTLQVDGNAQIFGAAVVGGDLLAGASSGGAPTIVFDQCAVEAAELALTEARLTAAPQVPDSPTFGWYEIVR
jgi:hypothetical protein